MTTDGIEHYSLDVNGARGVPGVGHDGAGHDSSRHHCRHCQVCPSSLVTIAKVIQHDSKKFYKL